jgi:hypothetical protein
MDLLTKCFEILSTNKIDMSWKMKYIRRFNDEEFVNEIARLEKKNSKLDRSISFNFESSDDDDESRSRSQSPRIRKSPSKTIDSPIRQVATQTPADILRSVSINIPKRHSKSPISTGTVTRVRADSLKAPPGVSAVRITEKKSAYIIQPSSEYSEEHHRSQSPRTRIKSNDKSQLVTSSSIIRETREQKIIEQASIKNMKEVFFENIHVNFLLLFSSIGTSINK